MLGDLAVGQPENVAGGEAQLPPGRREAVIDGVVDPFVDEARRAQVAFRQLASILTVRPVKALTRLVKKSTVAFFMLLPEGAGAAALFWWFT